MSLIKCPKCGEMFSDSYKTCPFCAEDEAYYSGRMKKKNDRGRRAAESGKRRMPSILGPVVIIVLLLLAALVVWLLWGEDIKDAIGSEKPPVTDADKDKTDKSDGEDQDEEPVISLNRSVLMLTVGDKETLSASGSDGETTWESSNPAVASVTSGGEVTALAEGNAVITARVGDDFAACTVTVKEEDTSTPDDTTGSDDTTTKPNTSTTKVDTSKLSLVTPYGIEVPYDTTNDRFDVTLKKGDVCAFTLKGTDLTPAWSSPNSSVATVTSGGEVTAVGKGEVTMTIKLGSTTVDFLLRVTN